MIYRVVLKIGYCTAAYDFDDMQAAGSFARMILTHQIETEDTKKKQYVTIEVIDPCVEVENED